MVKKKKVLDLIYIVVFIILVSYIIENKKINLLIVYMATIGSIGLLYYNNKKKNVLLFNNREQIFEILIYCILICKTIDRIFYFQDILELLLLLLIFLSFGLRFIVLCKDFLKNNKRLMRFSVIDFVLVVIYSEISLLFIKFVITFKVKSTVNYSYIKTNFYDEILLLLSSFLIYFTFQLILLTRARFYYLFLMFFGFITMYLRVLYCNYKNFSTFEEFDLSMFFVFGMFLGCVSFSRYKEWI